MKRLFFVIMIALFSNLVFTQVPESFNYQAVVRNAAGEPVISQQVSFWFTIYKTSPGGTIVYSEKHSPTTNGFGLVTINIGNGTEKTGDFTTIDWGTDSYFLNVQIDPAGGTSYIEMGTTQLLSVPYAMHAKTAANYIEKDPKVGVNVTNYLSKWDGTALVQSTIYDNGKVGIGTNSPSENLHIKTTTTDGNIVLEVPDGDGYYLGYNSGEDYMAISVINGGTLYWETLNLKSGNVGIGTNNPSARLDINGIIKSTGAYFTGTTTVPTPVNPTDAATKAYVDALLQIINQLESQPGILKDVDGNLYTTIKIGTQAWMCENLKTTKYNNGTAIPLVTDNIAWSNLTTPGYCWYNNDEATYKATYGALYNWYTVNTGNLCPAGWHVPSDTEWTILENYLIANGFNFDGTTTGNKIGKSLASTTLWTLSSNTGAVGNTDYPSKRNVTGFTALPGGLRINNGGFGQIGNYGQWWSTTENDDEIAWYCSMYYDNTGFYRNIAYKKYGLSIRCIKDE